MRLIECINLGESCFVHSRLTHVYFSWSWEIPTIFLFLDASWGFRLYVTDRRRFQKFSYISLFMKFMIMPVSQLKNRKKASRCKTFINKSIKKDALIFLEFTQFLLNILQDLWRAVIKPELFFWFYDSYPGVNLISNISYPNSSRKTEKIPTATIWRSICFNELLKLVMKPRWFLFWVYDGFYNVLESACLKRVTLRNNLPKTRLLGNLS